MSSRFPADFDSLEHFLSAIIDSSDDAIVTKDLNGSVTSWNHGAERVFGYTAAEMVGKPIRLLIPPERQAEEDEILARLRRGERVDHFSTKRVRKDGTEIEVSLTISPVKNRAGQVVGASKVARDVTVQSQAAKAIAAANEETLKQSRMKDEFLSTLSHELRTPLQSVVGWVQILRAPDVEPSELEQGLEVIYRNAMAQQRIIEDLLDMNRILSGKVRLDVQKLEVSPILQSAIDTVRPAADAKGVRIHAVLDSHAEIVSGDPQRLQQIFWNLLSNAIKFTPKAGRVEVFMERVNSHLEISITDNGIGISPDFLPFVFDRFRQADASMSRRQGGLGLGLAIVKHLVELHGGYVVAKSPGVDKGATFCVRLPLAAVRDREPQTVPQDHQSQKQRPVPQLEGISVLVVDDDEDSRVLIAKSLEKAGALVSTASGADDALRQIDGSSPHVLISDIGMPEKNGFALIEELRERPPEKGGRIPAAALTAYTRVEDRVQALCAGFQVLLPKPVDAVELVATVGSLARQSR